MQLKKIYQQYKAVILYLFFGALTTLVNIIAYWFVAHVMNAAVMLSTILAWILAVLFAYITNRKWVFDSKSNTILLIIKEIIYFFACRLFTGVLDLLCMYVFVDMFNYNDIIIKIIANVVVIILNYVFSKLIIFKNIKEL